MLKRIKSRWGASQNEVVRLSTELAETKHRLRNARQRNNEKDKEIEQLRLEKRGEDAFPAERIIWIFGAGRSGTTWLASMMQELASVAMWNEPLVGALFGEAYYGFAAHKRGDKFIMGSPHKALWLKTVRRMVLEGTLARYPAYSQGYVVIKEPHGSVGAPLLSLALPESRLILLVRDPRDAIASALDGNRKGGWIDNRGRALASAQEAPDAFVEERARVYLRDVGKAREAYKAHEGPKTLLRYEELRRDTAVVLQQAVADLQVPVKDEELMEAIEKHAWENMPEDSKGQGKFYRKADPGSWRNDLTPKQAEMVESLTAPLLKDLYPNIPT